MNKCKKCQMDLVEYKCKACSAIVAETEVETHTCGKDNVEGTCGGCSKPESECACAVTTSCNVCSKPMEECVCEA